MIGPAARRARTVGLVLAAVTAASAVLAGCSHSSGSPATLSRTDVQSMLDRHATAVVNDDRAAFAAGLDAAPVAARFRAAQLQEYANLAELPLASWRYIVGPRAQAAGAQRAAQRRFGASAVIYQVTLRYALRGIDSRPTSHQLYWTFVRSGDGSVVAADDAALNAVGGASWRGPWDFGPLTAVRGRHCLVLGHAATGHALLQSLAATVDAAVPRVSAVWGSAWSRDVLVIVPVGPAELQADLGAAAGDAAPVVAIETSDGTDPVTGTVLGQRLVVDPARLDRLSQVGRRIVLQHEVTHIATAAATTDATPTWLAEGFAEYVGNLGSGQPVPDAASELAASVRAGRVPRRLPASSAFTGPGAARAYEQAWLACRLIAARVHQAGLVRLYRLVGGDVAAAPLTPAHAVQRVLGESMSRFVAQWRDYLRVQLAAPR